MTTLHSPPPELDLDDLLAESINLVQARAAQKKGKKLTQDQQEILESNALAIHMETWRSVALIAHVELTVCRCCGTAWEGFSGWYEYQVDKRNPLKCLLQRLELEDELPNLPKSQHRTLLEVPHCGECLQEWELPLTDLEALPLLSSLGEAAEWESESNLEELFPSPLQDLQVSPLSLLEELS